jgi:hypothetical protein
LKKSIYVHVYVQSSAPAIFPTSSPSPSPSDTPTSVLSMNTKRLLTFMRSLCKSLKPPAQAFCPIALSRLCQRQSWTRRASKQPAGAQRPPTCKLSRARVRARARALSHSLSLSRALSLCVSSYVSRVYLARRGARMCERACMRAHTLTGSAPERPRSPTCSVQSLLPGPQSRVVGRGRR